MSGYGLWVTGSPWTTVRVAGSTAKVGDASGVLPWQQIPM